MKTVAAKQPSSLACIKFWVVVTLIMLLILWVFAMQLATPDDKIMVPKSAFYIPYDFPPQRVCKNNGYLIISPNRGLTQKGLGVADMVAIARYLNVTLIVPKFAYGTYWNDTSKFEDFFYVNHFITSLRDEVKILKEFTKPVEETGRKIVNILREKGPFFVLHLRYEKDILAFTICKQGLTKEEAEDVKQMKYSQDGWRHKPIASNKKRKHGLCPLTPEETALVLQALDIDENITIYIAAEEIYNKEKRMADLEATYPNLVSKQTILNPEELEPFMEHADQMAPLETIILKTGIDFRRKDHNRNIPFGLQKHAGLPSNRVGSRFSPKRRCFEAWGVCVCAKRQWCQRLVVGAPSGGGARGRGGMRRLRLKEARVAKVFWVVGLLGLKLAITAPMDYIVAIESDIFMPTFVGNIALAVQGHRRHSLLALLLTKKKLLFSLIVEYKNGTLLWDEFSLLVKKIHEDRTGKPAKRKENPDHARQEDSFYSNPQECLPTFACTIN
ncbi:hypothetical protein ES332_A13G113000v1 [Gossypium tomentosum]|uniref:O-fucosyltransferase family protein n=1 Tax=Gossypium tomentosum TaxID=34277 RepID=A0A5D2MJW6_GOSTO|nr:hypothetical protein ES332_A13G113000v1 [Gossypium tomentosum]